MELFLHLISPMLRNIAVSILIGEVGLEPTTFLCHGFTDRYPRRWVTPHHY